MALLQISRTQEFNRRLHHNEPFGPVHTIVVVDRIEELVSEMNISNRGKCAIQEGKEAPQSRAAATTQPASTEAGCVNVVS